MKSLKTLTLGSATCALRHVLVPILPILMSSYASAMVFQAEDYTDHFDNTPGNTGNAYRSDDVDIQVTDDVGGGHNVGWIDASEWLSYSDVSIPTTGMYIINVRVASANGASFSVDLNGGSIQLGSFDVPNTGGWQNWNTVSSTVHIEAGTYGLGVFAATGGWNFNWIEISPEFEPTPTATPTPTPTLTPTPTPTTTTNLVVQAEDYTNFSDTTPGNSGNAYRSDDVDIEITTDIGAGFDVGWTGSGEWLEFEVSLRAGIYDVATRVASQIGGAEYSLSLNGNLIGADSVNETGGWQAFDTHAVGNITATEGINILRLDVINSGFNINWISLDLRNMDDDRDGDEIPDHTDNCPDQPNPSQANHDGDALGNDCDPDDDNDGFSDSDEIAAGTDPFDENSFPTVLTFGLVGKLEAESTIDHHPDVVIDAGTVGWFDVNRWMHYRFDFKAGANLVRINLADGSPGGTFEIRLDSLGGPVIGTISPISTGGWNTYLTQNSAISPTHGLHDVYVVGTAGTGICNFDYFEFYSVIAPDAPSNLSALPSDTSIDLDWSDNSDNETGFNLYWSTSVTKPASPQISTGVNVDRFSITGLSPDTNYAIWLEAAGDDAINSEAVSTSAKTTGQAVVEDFVLMVVPDTQFMVMDFSHQGSEFGQYTAQTRWIVDEKDNLNIKFITHVGDVVDHSDRQNEWDSFKSGWSIIEDSGIPWSIAPGNHDTNLPMGVGSWDKFNQEFPAFGFFDKPWFGESYPAGEYANNLNFFEASGMEFMVISIGYGMNDDEFNWANQKLRQHPNKRAILSTHDVNRGRFVDLAKQNPNVFLLVSGHYCAQEWHNTFQNNAGQTVHEIMSDYQCGNNGFLRYYQFKPLENTVEAFTYKPQTGEYWWGPSSNFSWNYDMN